MRPGSGKTAVTLKALTTRNLVDDVFPALVLAPLRVARDVWSEEIPKWTFSEHLKISPVIGEVEERQRALNVKAHIFSSNYEQIPWLVKTFGKRWPFRTIIADESSRLKNFRIRQGGARARELYKVSFPPFCYRFIELTGSPCSNGLIDVYGPQMFLDQGDRLGRTFTSFEQRWFARGWDGYRIKPLPHAEAEIHDKLRDICLSVHMEDWIDLAKPVETIISITLPPAARKIYDDMERDMFVTIEREGIEAFSAAAKRNKTCQLANGFCYQEDGKTFKVTHDEKIKALESLVEEHAGMPLLVSYHYKADLARLQKAFPHAVNLAEPDGIKKFKTGDYLMGLAHPASVSHGIDGLQTVTNVLVYFSHTDNLEHHQQIAERIGPMRQMQSGLDRPVYIFHLVGKNTVEEYAVLPNLQGKGTVQELLMQALKARKT